MSDEIYLHFSEQRKAQSDKRKSSQKPWNFNLWKLVKDKL